MTLVCDASALVALLVDGGESGEWAAATVSGHELIAPHLIMFEVANILRRHELAGLVSVDQAAQAHRDLLDLAIDLWPYEAVATRVWELRRNLSAYDAASVATAEEAGVSLVTLDQRIGRAPSVRCDVLSP